MRRLFSRLFLIFFFSFVVSSLSAQLASGPNKECEDSGAKMEQLKKEMTEKLHLSKEQEQSLEENRKNHRDRLKDLFGKIKEKRVALIKEMQNAQFEKEKATVIHNELKQLTNSMMDLRFESILKVRELLSPEQRKLMFEQFEGKFGGFSTFGHKGHKSTGKVENSP